VILAAAALLASYRLPLSAQSAQPLFEAVPTASVSADADGPTILRSRAVVASFARLASAAAAGVGGDRSTPLSLNLFDDVVLAAEFERFETDVFGHQSWVGRVTGFPTSTVTLTWKGDVLSGGVQVGEDLYRIETRGGGAPQSRRAAASRPSPSSIPEASVASCRRSSRRWKR
jgi:hypothetical protein